MNKKEIDWLDVQEAIESSLNRKLGKDYKIRAREIATETGIYTKRFGFGKLPYALIFAILEAVEGENWKDVLTSTIVARKLEER